jgi:hypothetical protein
MPQLSMWATAFGDVEFVAWTVESHAWAKCAERQYPCRRAFEVAPCWHGADGSVVGDTVRQCQRWGAETSSLSHLSP